MLMKLIKPTAILLLKIMMKANDAIKANKTNNNATTNDYFMQLFFIYGAVVSQ